MNDNAPLPTAPPVWGWRFESDRLFVELCPKQPYQVRYQPRWHILGFALESQTGYHAFASDRITAYHAPANTFTFTPANCETFSESTAGGTYLVFALSPELFNAYLEDLAKPQTRRLEHRRDRHVTALGRAARQFIQAHPVGGQLYFEALAGQFATHVILALLSKPEVPHRSTPLPHCTLKQLMAFVDAHLCEDLSLSALAHIAGMAPSRFMRSFKQTTGRSPHAWLITRRLTHAQTLLASTAQPIAQIALDCGFSSQSHMTTLFSKQLGVTPKQYRDSVK